MSQQDMVQVARAIVAPNKGILAADESTLTIGKRLATIGVTSTEASRREYREMLFRTAGIDDFISGVILFDETLRQAASDGTPLVDVLNERGIIPGIKVDKGARPLAGFDGETVTEGLDGLRERLAEYHALGARFAKWRAVIAIDEKRPSDFGIEANAHALARYAALCQEASIVPIIEPEVLMDGEHTIERCEDVSEKVLRIVFDQLDRHRVFLPAALLKPNMVISGLACATQADVKQVAEATVRVLTKAVPAELPGVVFLSGGQSSEDATDHLSAMNVMGLHPWELSFSYGRALQAAPLAAWGGQPENVDAAQAAFLKRCRLNGLARSGAYRRDMEHAV